MNHQKTTPASSTKRHKNLFLGLVMTIGVVSCAFAWRDLARRGEEEVRGPKFVWRLFITINPGNSLFYWLFARK